MPLLVCATPIGNLGDVTLRVLEALREAEIVVCEDTRRTRVLLARYDINAELLRFDQHREERRVAELLPRLEAGETLALVSDAGLPALSDPGGRLIAAARQAGHVVSVLPGATAVETALVASGFAADRFTFVGFIPRRESQRAALWRETAGWAWPTVAFDSPRRLGRSLASLAQFDADRSVAVCRELTKLHEEIVIGTAAELSQRFGEATRGEITVVLDTPGTVVSLDRRAATAVVRNLVAEGVGRRTAARLVAELSGLSANTLYTDSLEG